MSGVEEEVVIILDETWVNSLRKSVAEAQWKPRGTQPNIFRVPEAMRRLDSNAYQPRIISLVPYHHDTLHQLPTNELKWYYLRQFLARDHVKSLEDYLKEMKEMEKRARSAYSEDIKMGSNEFIQMMLLDCCFVVEILLRKTLYRELHKQDPILSTAQTEGLVNRDMMRLENQLPFSLIQSLFKSTLPSQQQSLEELALRSFNGYLYRNPEMSSSSMEGRHHLLHLFHSSFIPQKNQNNRDNEPTFLCHNISPNVSWLINKLRFRRSSMPHQQSSMPASIPCARELEDAGVKLKRKKEAASFLDITFHKGTIEIPQFEIYDDTNYLLRNLIAFEQCYPDAGTSVADYASLMDCIIDTPEDVALLQRHGIIVDCLGNSDEIASFFNTLCKEVGINFEGSYLEDVVRDVHKYCNTKYHKWRAILMHNYFSSPWAIVSLGAALLLLLLTVAQTIFTILGYGQTPHNN